MKLINGMLCPVCETGKLLRIEKDIDFTYKGETIFIKNAAVYLCEQCREELLNDKDERAIERSLTDRRRNKDGLLTSDQIRSVRLKFGLSQVEFARELGVGEKNFARYETGQATQSRTMDNLLRILMAYPSSISVINKSKPPVNQEEIILKTTMKMRKSSPHVKIVPKNCLSDQEGNQDECAFLDSGYSVVGS